MATYIALLRGINIVGNNRLSMADLRKLCEKKGLCDVRTYIQSGNVLFCGNPKWSPASFPPGTIAKDLGAAILKSHGFEPRVLVLTASELKRAAAANPYPQAHDNPRSLHLFFLAAKPLKPDLAAMNLIKAKSESFALAGKVFYLHTPDGFGTSKLAERAERLLGVAATARNWRTVTTLIEMSTAKIRRQGFA